MRSAPSELGYDAIFCWRLGAAISGGNAAGELPYAAEGARPRAMAWLFCLFAACPLESFFRSEGCLGRGVEEYAALEAYVNRTGGPDDPDGARELYRTLREVLVESSSGMPAEDEPGDAMEVFLHLFAHFDKILQRTPCDRPATLESSHYDADDARAALGAVRRKVWWPRPDGVISTAFVHYERQVTKFDHHLNRSGHVRKDSDKTDIVWHHAMRGARVRRAH